MNGNRGEDKNINNFYNTNEDSKKIFLFGTTLLFVGMLIKGDVSIPDILIILGLIFALKGIIMLFIASKK